MTDLRHTQLHYLVLPTVGFIIPDDIHFVSRGTLQDAIGDFAIRVGQTGACHFLAVIPTTCDVAIKLMGPSLIHECARKLGDTMLTEAVIQAQCPPVPSSAMDSIALAAKPQLRRLQMALATQAQPSYN